MTRLIRRLSLSRPWRRTVHGRHLLSVATPQPVHPWFELREQRVLELAERR